jgi:predicted transcriptional regulator of viral defense system
MTPPPQTRCFKEALARLRDLFVDRPGVKLTTLDAAQMSGLDRQVCRVLLRTLTATGFLERGVGGSYSSATRTLTNREAKGLKW